MEREELMKAVLLYIFCFINFSSLYGNGFDGDTTIATPSGRFIPIKKLKVGDEVICYNKDLLPASSQVKGICTSTVDSIIEITMQDNIVLVASINERFFLPKENQWVYAKDIKKGHCFLNENLEAIPVIKVEKHYGLKKVFIITVDKYHNFLASSGKYLVHNGAGGAAFGALLGKILVYVTVGGIVALANIIPGGGLVAGAIVAALATPIEVTSNVAAVAGGIFLGTLTGPV
jgi:hypothetical protein